MFVKQEIPKRYQRTVTIDRLKEAVDEFEKVQTKYKKYGTADSEPWYCFKDGCRATIDNREPTLPHGWELFDHTMNCGTATRALNSAAKKVYKLLARANGRVIEEFQSYYGL